MKSFISTVVGGIALLAAAGAQAVTYDAFTSFDASSNPSGGFTYGSYSSGVFTAYTPGGTCLFANTTCMTAGDYLGVYKTSDGLAHTSGTVNVPADALLLHPGSRGEISLITWTAPTTGVYTVALDLFDADTNPDHSVKLFGYYSGIPGLVSDLDIALNLNSFSNVTSLFFHAGDVFGYGVEYNGSYFFDATGINLSISRVPEPATWALLIGGFAMTGVAMRRRRTPLAA